MDDLVGDVAAIKAIARGGDRGLAAAITDCALGINQAPEKIAECRIFDDLAGKRNLAVGQIECCAGWPSVAEFLLVAQNRSHAEQPGEVLGRLAMAGQSRMHRHPVLAEFEAGLEHLSKAFGPE